MRAIVDGAKASSRDLTKTEMTDLETKSTEAMELKEQIERGEKSMALMDHIGNMKSDTDSTPKGPDNTPAKSLGAHFIKHLGKRSLRSTATITAPRVQGRNRHAGCRRSRGSIPARSSPTLTVRSCSRSASVWSSRTCSAPAPSAERRSPTRCSVRSRAAPAWFGGRPEAAAARRRPDLAHRRSVGGRWLVQDDRRHG